MQTKEELLQYLRDNWKNVGHPLYYAGTDKIRFIFKRKLPIKDIEDFLQRNHPYTGDKKPQINFTPLVIKAKSHFETGVFKTGVYNCPEVGKNV